MPLLERTTGLPDRTMAKVAMKVSMLQVTPLSLHGPANLLSRHG